MLAEYIWTGRIIRGFSSADMATKNTEKMILENNRWLTH